MASTPALSAANPSQALLSRAHSPDASARIFADKVQKKPLLLRPTEPSINNSNSDARHQRQAARQLARARAKSKPRPLSAAQKRALRLYELPAAQRKYAVWEPLHGMWCAYMREILGIGGAAAYVTAATAGPKLASADFHGAVVEVVRARCVGRVGVRGVVVKDTKFTFEIVTPRDQVKTIPKEHTIFRFEIPLAAPAPATAPDAPSEKPRSLVFELHGSQFENRAPDRANKKFKQHNMTDL
ncbi:uncharacterized protein K452DRAFT_271710 [Aplosporella prunicola CBS 121167]|uniref:Ribonuclease P protein subunit n=1 Tax=Aplosporella prunicola CBS 121167 TaxID=1176127 RepID=A0A6A6BEB3_9PEZI|nr:uncharacterized protein K452DRAFT_271710 [Aplosporella prunicola CBS 121167]KAF2141868.1 hypothetical protein K452DRAFT_271710 [Aplosporella prunicola CBS 121167]